MDIIEMLVVLHVKAGDAANRVRARFEVAAALTPRLLIVRLAADDLVSLQEIDGVAAVTANPVELDVTPPLSDTERLFAAGWAVRGVKSEPRAGDGLAWDAPGFEPPDASGH